MAILNCGLFFILLMHDFHTIVKQIIILYVLGRFIDNEKGIEHFKIVQSAYSLSGVFLQHCEATGSPTLFAPSSSCVTVTISFKMIRVH